MQRLIGTPSFFLGQCLRWHLVSLAIADGHQLSAVVVRGDDCVCQGQQLERRWQCNRDHGTDWVRPKSSLCAICTAVLLQPALLCIGTDRSASRELASPLHQSQGRSPPDHCPSRSCSAQIESRFGWWSSTMDAFAMTHHRLLNVLLV